MKKLMEWLGRRQGGFTLIELMIVVAVISIMAALAVPNYLRYRAQSRTAEARTNLGGVFVSEVSFYGENSRFSNFSEIGFTLAGSANRYTYRAMQTTVAGGVVSPGPIETRNAAIGIVTADNTVVPAASTGTGFTATATGNMDEDPTVDQWHVNDLKQNLQNADTSDITS